MRTAKPIDRVVELAPLPQLGRKRSLGVLISFALCVVLPVLAGSAYYFGYASRQYVSGFSFMVQDAKTAATGVSSMGLPTLMGAGGMPTNSAQNYMVVNYLLSWEAVEELQRRIDIRRMFSRSEIDWLARLDPSASTETLVSHWRKLASASYDQITGLGVVQVRAFSPEDAHLIATTLVTLAEELVNNVANRPQRDAVRFAENDVKRAEDRLQAVRGDLTRYRNVQQLIEPQASAVTTNVTLVQSLRANLNQLETELAVLSKEKLSSGSRVVANLQTRIQATRDQLAAMGSQVAQSREGTAALSTVVAEYEYLDMERQFAQSMVTMMMGSLEQARAAALSQHVYVTIFINPILPQKSLYPKRVWSVLLVALGCLLLWSIALLVVGSVRERLT